MLAKCCWVESGSLKLNKLCFINISYLDLSIICSELCRLDSLFPPNGLWVEYYGISDLRDIITVKSTKKRMGAIL